MEIRLHGRGGQGGVTCAKILASAYARRGKHVQTFGDYAGERSGAPVRAYTRVDDQPITNRNKVYRPDHVIVLDQHLLGRDTLDGLAPGGILLVNSGAAPASFDGTYGAFRLATVDATSIARRRGIGTRSVVIVNTTIAGAFARLDGIPLEVLEATYRALGFLSNFDAAREAYENVAVREPQGTATPAWTWTDKSAPVQALAQHVESLPTGLRTGSWSSQRPKYLENPAPCNAWCPAGNDVVGFVQAAARAGDAGAALVLRRTTPLPGTCGRVCPAPCMEGCNRVEFDGAVNIRGLERWISDHSAPARREGPPDPDPLSIAIVGSGPAGLSAAFTLALAGHAVTIYEREQLPGGLLASGIPNYRLPRDVLQREIAGILELGVTLRCGEDVSRERLRELAGEHDALILATGLQKIQTLQVSGVTLAGVEDGLGFLRRVNLEGGVKLSGHVVVLGGGNTAMDCARSALRCGAERVTVAYRRARADMPAIAEEIEQAEQEGVELRVLRAPVSFVGTAKLEALELAEVELGEPDASGRRRPITTERVERLACDHALLALGQSAERGFLPAGWEFADGRIREGGRPLDVFAAGDFATGDGTVAHALGSGRYAATLALRELGRDVEVFERPERALAVPATDIRYDHFERCAAAHERHGPSAQRRRDFLETSAGLENALEAHRCFSCGHCTRCDTCLVYCPEGVIRRNETAYDLDYTYCKGCGICVHECPRKGMEMTTL